MASQFFVTDKLKPGVVTLEGGEYHHLARVLRHQVGDKIVLFDGTGKLADGEITFISRTAATVKVDKPYMAPAEVGPEITVAVALPRLQRASWLIEKCVELGVSRFIPLSTEHVVVHPRESKLENLREVIIQACKQCGRAKLMDIEEVTPWKTLVAQEFELQPVVVAHPGGVAFNEGLINSLCPPVTADGQGPRKLLLAIGPEGGFSVEEVTKAMTNGATLVSLGPRLLRVETAALLMASVVQASQIGR